MGEICFRLILKEGALHGNNNCVKPQVGVSAKKRNRSTLNEKSCDTEQRNPSPLLGETKAPAMRGILYLPLFLSFIQHSMLDVRCSMFIRPLETPLSLQRFLLTE